MKSEWSLEAAVLGQYGKHEHQSHPGVLRLRRRNGERSALTEQPTLATMMETIQQQRARAEILLSSSMAEHPAVNRRVVGSSPT